MAVLLPFISVSLTVQRLVDVREGFYYASFSASFKGSLKPLIGWGGFGIYYESIWEVGEAFSSRDLWSCGTIFAVALPSRQYVKRLKLREMKQVGFNPVTMWVCMTPCQYTKFWRNGSTLKLVSTIGRGKVRPITKAASLCSLSLHNQYLVWSGSLRLFFNLNVLNCLCSSELLPSHPSAMDESVSIAGGSEICFKPGWWMYHNNPWVHVIWSWTVNKHDHSKRGTHELRHWSWSS